MHGTRVVVGLVVLALAPGCELLFAPDPGGPVDAPPPRPWQATSIGTGQHRCAIDQAGGLWCWGRGREGQVGDGTSENHAARVEIERGERWRTVGTGVLDTCALRADGSMWCWGYGIYGQLGDGASTSSKRAVRVLDGGGTRRWTHLAVGAAHACAIAEDGLAWCWGYGASGQLGDGGTPVAAAPVQAGAATWTALAGGGAHVCGIQTDGTMWCWGYNAHGQLGNGSTTDANVPTPVTSTATWTAVAAGNSHSCGITAGALYCWGEGANGELGDGAGTAQSTPVEVITAGNGSPWVSIAGGDHHTCGVRMDGSLWCWGYDGYGELGDGDETGASHLTPSRVGVDHTWTRVATGSHDTCALADDATLWCTGNNAFGTLGDGLGGPRTAPVHILDDVTAVAAGDYHTCAVSAQRTYCWGFNQYGQVDPSGLDRRVPVEVTAQDATSVAAGPGHSCEVRASDATMWCWGDDSYGELGDGPATTGPAPTPVLSAGGWLGADASWHTCAVRATSQEVTCWGYNSHGQLGDGSTTTSDFPVVTQTVGMYDAVATGYEHTCGVASDHTLQCWGRNYEGQLGDGTGTDQPAPVSVGGIDWADLDLGGLHSCARRLDGSLWCWGANTVGQLGDGTTTSQYVPVPVPGSWTRVSGGNQHTCAIRDDRTLACWGHGAWGKLGTGSASGEDQWSPADVATGSWLAVSAGFDHTCGIQTDNSLWCWGTNASGQVGDGSAWRSEFAAVP